MRRKVHVTWSPTTGWPQRIRDPSPRHGYFKQIQGWEAAGFVKIIRPNDHPADPVGTGRPLQGAQ